MQSKDGLPLETGRSFSLEMNASSTLKAYNWFDSDIEATNVDGCKVVRNPAIVITRIPFLHQPVVLVDVAEQENGNGLLNAVFIAILGLGPAYPRSEGAGGPEDPSFTVKTSSKHEQRWFLH
jgi:hypothetical protein